MLARVFHVLGFHLLTHMSVYSRTCMLLVVQCEFLDSNAKYGPSGSSKLCCWLRGNCSRGWSSSSTSWVRQLSEAAAVAGAGTVSGGHFGDPSVALPGATSLQ